jgi:hypothetical protein
MTLRRVRPDFATSQSNGTAGISTRLSAIKIREVFTRTGDIDMGINQLRHNLESSKSGFTFLFHCQRDNYIRRSLSHTSNDVFLFNTFQRI